MLIMFKTSLLWNGGAEFELFLDADEAHEYIVSVYKKDKTLLDTQNFNWIDTFRKGFGSTKCCCL